MINQNTKISSALTALAVVCVTAFTGTLAHAQLEEIVVTAQKREASLQDTPISITAFDAAAIEAEGIFDVRDMGPLAVNVQINSQPASEDNIGMNELVTEGDICYHIAEIYGTVISRLMSGS